MKYIFLNLFFFLICSFSKLTAQELYNDTIISKKITSVSLSKKGLLLSEPSISLNSNDKLILTFDNISQDNDFLNYTIVHCDANWRKSDLLSNEYLQTFTYDQISDIKFSSLSELQYSTHTLIFPNDNINITKSGNYALIVYGNSEEEIYLIKRFYVYENLISINANIKQSVKINDKFKKQKLDIFLTKSSFAINNYSNLKLFVKQNGRTDNIQTAKPTSISGNEIQYTNDDDFVFNGGNEFRLFDVSSKTALLENVEKIENNNRQYSYYLYEDKFKNYNAYETKTDLNGKLHIRNEEYVYVNFFLQSKLPIYNGDIYIYGELTDWKILPYAKMLYNAHRLGYEGVLYIKQGLYNYQFVFVDNKTKSIDETIVEGNHWNTENQYTIFVYYRPEGAVYDRLIGLKNFKNK